LREHRITVDLSFENTPPQAAGRQCPGSQTVAFPSPKNIAGDRQTVPSQLSHWPIQLHLISPSAPHYRNSDLLIAADCVAYSYGDFHRDYLKSRALAIACPKLDANQEIYLDKLTGLIDHARLKSIQVMIMQVPCCSGLLHLVVEAARHARHRVPVSCVTVGIRGEILGQNMVEIEQTEAFGA
jgi:hypothetical protein